MKNILILFFSLSISIISVGQTKNLTIEDATSNYSLYPKNLSALTWRNNQNYTFIDQWTNIVQGSINNDSKDTILKLDDLNKLLKDANIPVKGYIASYDYFNENEISFFSKNFFIIYNLNDKKINLSIKLDENAENQSFCKENQTLAYTIDNNLFFADVNSKVTQITNDTDKGIVNGNPYVHRQEFGIDNGIFWSPKGSFLAFYRKDETMVADYPLVDIDMRIASLKNIKYPMTGETSEQVSLGIFNIKTGKTIFIKPSGKADDYLTRITWDPTEKYIYIAELNRDQNHMKLNKFDAETGKFILTLFEEKNSKYVEPEHDMIFLKSNLNQFLWYSERDGFDHLYLYDTSEKLIKQVTKGNWVVTDFLGFDKDEKNIFISSTAVSPIERHTYMVNLKSGKMLQLTKEKGTHSVQINKASTFILDSYTSTTVPRKVILNDIKGKLNKEIFSSENPIKDYKIGEMTISTLKSADGKTDLYYRMIKPVNFDPNKKYPVIVYVYGGPHAQLVTNSWLGGTGHWDYFMATEGYIMFTLDNRGSANRGFEFESVIHRYCGQNEMADQMKGIEFLKSLPYVDQDRIGVDGWSYGGFMTTSLMLNHPETFKVGVAGGPVIDWKYYEVMYGERYMDTPQDNPDGYEKTSLLNKADKLEGRLLIIHGTVDPVVVWQNSLDFINKCIKNDKQVDYFVYPGHEHNVRGKDRVHLMKKITRYFDDFLK
ncbi:MAG: DPP IV N-terminal domain-containing protein [Bacteroidales bacterium]|nr:DPP IV N-terminal domain-containing protein [Bacteroidales bacterium]